QASTGVTLLFISHDLGVVQQMAQSVLVLRHGAVQAYGRTEDIFRHPPNDYTRLLLEASAAPVFSSGHGNRAKPAASTDSDILLFSSRTALHETPSPHR